MNNNKINFCAAVLTNDGHVAITASATGSSFELATHLEGDKFFVEVLLKEGANKNSVAEFKEEIKYPEFAAEVIVIPQAIEDKMLEFKVPDNGPITLH